MAEELNPFIRQDQRFKEIASGSNVDMSNVWLVIIANVVCRHQKRFQSSLALSIYKQSQI